MKEKPSSFNWDREVGGSGRREEGGGERYGEWYGERYRRGGSPAILFTSCGSLTTFISLTSQFIHELTRHAVGYTPREFGVFNGHTSKYLNSFGVFTTETKSLKIEIIFKYDKFW